MARTYNKRHEVLLYKVRRWVERDEEVHPAHTCYMEMSIVATDENGGRDRLLLDYRRRGKSFRLHLVPPPHSPEAVVPLYDVGEEDEGGWYWKIYSDNAFVAFDELPDLKTVVRYIDTVYTE